MLEGLEQFRASLKESHWRALVAIVGVQIVLRLVWMETLLELDQLRGAFSWLGVGGFTSAGTAVGNSLDCGQTGTYTSAGAWANDGGGSSFVRRISLCRRDQNSLVKCYTRLQPFRTLQPVGNSLGRQQDFWLNGQMIRRELFWWIWVCELVNCKRATIDYWLRFTHECPQGLVVKSRGVAWEEERQNHTHWSYLSFPNTTHVPWSWGVHLKIDPVARLL